MSSNELDIRSLDYPNILASRARELGSRTYLRCENARYTFVDAHLLSNRIANGLLTAGVKRGDHVALLLDNCPEIAWYYFGIGKMGGASVPLNTAAKGELLARYLRQSQVSCVVVEVGLLDRLLEEIGRAHV